MPIQPLWEQEEKALLVSASWRWRSRAWSRGLAPTTTRCTRRTRVATATQDTLHSSFFRQCSLTRAVLGDIEKPTENASSGSCAVMSNPRAPPETVQEELLRHRAGSAQLSITWCQAVPGGMRHCRVWAERVPVAFWQQGLSGTSHATPASLQQNPVCPISEQS